MSAIFRHHNTREGYGRRKTRVGRMSIHKQLLYCGGPRKPARLSCSPTLCNVEKILTVVQVHFVAENWSNFIPPLMSIAEESDTRYRAKGIECIVEFLQKCPTQILADAGLDVVFEQSLISSLSLLPSITPEEESVKVLKPAYRALASLAKAKMESDSKSRLLDRIFREGIVNGYHHAGDSAPISEIIFNQVVALVQESEIHTAKHIKVRSSTLFTSPSYGFLYTYNTLTSTGPFVHSRINTDKPFRHCTLSQPDCSCGRRKGDRRCNLATFMWLRLPLPCFANDIRMLDKRSSRTRLESRVSTKRYDKE